MKNKKIMLILIPLLLMVGCGRKQEVVKKEPVDNKNTGMVIKEKKTKSPDVINNMLVGKSKISFNNVSYDLLSDGKFSQTELWGTFQSREQQKTYIQLNAADNEQEIYGDIDGYELKGVDWQEDEYVQYLGLMEEAIQYSKDGKAAIYKARTGDIIFSIAMFGKNKLTDKDILTFKSLAKEVKVEYVESQITTN